LGPANDQNGRVTVLVALRFAPDIFPVIAAEIARESGAAWAFGADLFLETV
jgi:hypothetical protein